MDASLGTLLNIFMRIVPYVKNLPMIKSTENLATHNRPDVHTHEVLQGLDGDGSCRDEEPEALLEAQGRLDLLEHDLVGDHVAPVGRGGVAVD